MFSATRHVRVQRVVLEHHRDVAVLGRLLRDVACRRCGSRRWSTSSRPASMRSAVDLPEPDGPTSTMNSPSVDLEIELIDRRERRSRVNAGRADVADSCHRLFSVAPRTLRDWPKWSRPVRQGIAPREAPSSAGRLHAPVTRGSAGEVYGSRQARVGASRRGLRARACRGLRARPAGYAARVHDVTLCYADLNRAALRCKPVNWVRPQPKGFFRGHGQGRRIRWSEPLAWTGSQTRRSRLSCAGCAIR